MNLTFATQLLNRWIYLPNMQWYQVLPIATDNNPGFKADNGNIINLACEQVEKLEWYTKHSVSSKEIYCG